MLITRRHDGLYLVDQNEHGRLAGEIAGRWGNDRFATPARRESAVRAAAMHDEGWREADEEPLFNADAGRPLQFLEIDAADHVPLYARGVERVYELDPYAGLLVSMHWTGLYRSRWGMQDGRIEFAGEPARDEAVEEQERRWIEVKRALTRDARRSDLEISLWHTYDLLQTWDLLALYVPIVDLRPADAGVAPLPVPATLKSLEQEPGPRTVDSVPTQPGGERAQLTLTAVEPGVV